MSKIREARIKYHLTQHQMAELTGVPFRTIQNWEGGQRKCPDYVETLVLEKLDRMLGEQSEVIANGVIVPPCKVGDTVYIIEEGDGECAEDYVLGVEVLQFFINKHGIAVDLKLPLGIRLNTWAVFGKTVFLTREEAEKALKGDEGK